MKWKLKRGVNLICKKHGATAAVLGECSPDDNHRFEVTCKGNGKRNSCRHHEYASEKQVTGILKAYPNIELKTYQPNPWDAFFTE